MGRTARTILVGICAIVPGLVLMTPGVATANNAAGGTITATWSGSLRWDEVYDPTRPAIIQGGATFSWSYSITVRSTASGGTVVGKPSLTVGGSIYSQAASPNQGLDCTGTVVRSPSGKPDQFGPVGIVWGAPSWELNWQVPDVIWATATGRPNSSCAGAPAPPCGPPPAPRVSLRPQQLPWTQTISLSGTGNLFGPGKGAVNCWVTGSATITFTGTGGAGSPPLPPMPGRYRAKALATLFLEATYEDALYPCIAAGATIPLYGLGPPGQIAALGIGAVGGPLCVSYIKKINDLAQIIRDPPLRSYEEIARPVTTGAMATGLPPCSKYSGSAATFCSQFDPAVQNLLAVEQHAQSVAAAMDTTISRETGALAAHNYAAVRKQDRTLVGLDRKFKSAQTAETAAGARVAALMNGAGLPATLTISQSATAVTAVTRALGKAGLSARKLHSLLGTPAIGVYDWLQALVS